MWGSFRESWNLLLNTFQTRQLWGGSTGFFREDTSQVWTLITSQMQILCFAKVARAYETWKQCQWIMWTLTCKHKIRGKNWLYLRSYLKAFPVFNVLETCRVYLLIVDLGIFKFIKKFIERFFKKCEICRHGPNYLQKL